MVLRKGWIVLKKDGSVVTEEDIHWDSLDKRSIKELRLVWYDKVWRIADKAADKYIQFKSATQAIGERLPTILSRCIGYTEEDGSAVIIRVNEETGRAMWEVKEAKGV